MSDDAWTLDFRALWGTICPECGTPFALMYQLAVQRYNDGKSVWCPNGHTLRIAKEPKR